MKRILIATVGLLLNSSLIFGSINSMLDLRLLDIEKADSIEVFDSTIALHIIDEAKKRETYRPFVDFVSMDYVYKLPDFPCIRIYNVGDAKVTMGTFNQEPYEQFLFNICDSTLYPFGGGDVRFSQIFKSYLSEITKDSIITRNFIEFYINTLDDNNCYYLISNVLEYRKIWDKYNNFRKVENTLEEIQEDIKQVRESIEPFIIDKMDGYIAVKFTTWDLFQGDIEYWEIRITEDVFDVYSRFVLHCNVGPSLRKD